MKIMIVIGYRAQCLGFGAYGLECNKRTRANLHLGELGTLKPPHPTSP